MRPVYPLPDIRTGHRASVYGLAHDPSSGAVFTTDGAGQIVRWQPDQPDGVLIAQGQSPWYTCCYLTETNTLVAGNLVGQIWWINPDTLQVNHIAEAHRRGVFAFLPIAQGCVSGGADGVLHLWYGHEKSASIKLAHTSIRDLAYSHDQTTIAAAASDGNIYILDSQTLTVKTVLAEAHLPAVFAVCFSACGKYLFSGGRDAQLAIWDIADGFALLQRIPAHYYTINSICLDTRTNGTQFFTASRDRTIKCWDAETFQLLQVMEAAKYSVHTASVNRLLVAPHGLWSVSDDKRVVRWE